MEKSQLALWLLFAGLLPSAESRDATDADLEWWQKTIVYQIYPRSFQDSDGDGVGDLKGITSRLAHLNYIGVEAVWLSPVYKSPMKDFGYDISDHKDIDPIFGTLTDFDELIAEAHNRGIKVIMDYIPNHTSDLHPWFQQSRENQEGPFSDYYIWNDGVWHSDGTRSPPNNWLSVFGGSAWEWDDTRQQYYFHQFLKEQPDLNFRNPLVRREMKANFRFWCERGVDGFRIDAIGTLFETLDLKDEPRSNQSGVRPDEYEYLEHVYTANLPEIHGVVRGWREELDICAAKRGQHIFMVMEIYDPEQDEAMKYYYSGADLPFNFNLMMMPPECGGSCIRALVDKWLDKLPQGKWPNFVTGNHDQRRITTRKGPEYDRAMNMLLLTLPGTPTTYYGEEIGQRDITVTYEETQDPWGRYYGPDLYIKYSRDPERAPMQWSSEKNAGFSTAEKCWLPVNKDYITRNVEKQKGDRKSVLEAYRSLSFLRRDPAFMNSKLHYAHTDDDIISYRRKESSSCGYLVIINLGSNESTKDYSSYVSDCSLRATIIQTTENIELGKLDKGAFVTLTNISLLPGQGVILRLENKHTEL